MKTRPSLLTSLVVGGHCLLAAALFAADELPVKRVVLFTSGSEKAPKAVPLTHANIIADQRALVVPIALARSDSILSFLPMFHSFGLTISTLFPVLGGVKMVCHPDPTDAGALARKIASYQRISDSTRYISGRIV